MEQRVYEHIHPGIITMQAMLRKIDRLRLPLPGSTPLGFAT